MTMTERRALMRRAEGALRGLFRESLHRMDDDRLLQYAVWCEWLRDELRKETTDLDKLSDEQVQAYLEQVAAQMESRVT